MTPVTVANPGDSSLPTVHERSPISDVEQWLTYIQAEAARGPLATVLQVIPLVAGFRHGADRVSGTVGSGLQELRRIRTLSEFLGLSKESEAKTIRLGLFITWVGTYVGKTVEEINNMHIHSWLGMIISVPKEQGNGRMVIIWDCDAEESLTEVRQSHEQAYIQDSAARRARGDDVEAFRFLPRAAPPVLQARQRHLETMVREKGRTVYKGTWLCGEKDRDRECLSLALEMALAIARGEKGVPGLGWNEVKLQELRS